MTPCRCFNPRTRVGCDRQTLMWACMRRAFQSTHPRGVRPAVFASAPRGTKVSIHAPAWGATLGPADGQGLGIVSIHAPAWGATRWMRYWSPPASWFQSTHPRGVRPYHVDVVKAFYDVSIHAPAWGATACPATQAAPYSGFNPRTRVGCDDRAAIDSNSAESFNPRTRVGCDPERDPDKSHGLQVSIHAPAWGATRDPDRPGAHSPRFNPRTRVGCDDDAHAVCQLKPGVSIHAPAWGATTRNNCRIDCTMFQSTHPRGVRRRFPA